MADSGILDSERLSAALRGQVDELARLQTLLEAEYRVLGERDTQPLIQLAREKAESAERLAELTAAGEAQLQAAGLPPGRTGWMLWIQSLPTSQRTSLESLWASLVEGLETVARQNQINGQVLELRRQGTESLLDALRGTTRDTYGPRPNGSSGQTLAEV